MGLEPTGLRAGVLCSTTWASWVLLLDNFQTPQNLFSFFISSINSFTITFVFFLPPAESFCFCYYKDSIFGVDGVKAAPLCGRDDEGEPQAWGLGCHGEGEGLHWVHSPSLPVGLGPLCAMGSRHHPSGAPAGLTQQAFVIVIFAWFVCCGVCMQTVAKTGGMSALVETSYDTYMMAA